MLTGQVGCVINSRGWMGKAIEWFTRSPAHHVIVAVSDTECISAEPGGCRRRMISEYETVVWSQYDYTEQGAALIAGLAEYSIHQRYNYLAFVALAFSYGLRMPIDAGAAEWLNSRGSTTCSQLARDIVRVLHPVPIAGVPCPGDWLELIEGMWPELSVSVPSLDAQLLPALPIALPINPRLSTSVAVESHEAMVISIENYAVDGHPR